MGSLELDGELMRRVGLREGEYVAVWNVESGERFETYVFEGGKGVVGVNGAAAHRAKVGDRLIIAAFTWTDEEIIPQVVLLGENNEILKDLTPTTHG